MFDGLILGAASLLNQGTGQYFHEEVIQIPAGISEISTEFDWNALSMFDEQSDAIPHIWYEKDGEFMPWITDEDHDGNVEEGLLKLLFSAEPKQKLIIKSEEPVELVAHFYNTHVVFFDEVV